MMLVSVLIFKVKIRFHAMKLFQLLNARRAQSNRTLQQLHDMTGIATSSVSKLLSGKSEAKSGTLEALADALDADWVLVPRHLLPEVQRLLSGKAIGPDAAPSTVDQLFGGGANE
jgi:transcriptional regulator with XRE-family HTH domain